MKRALLIGLMLIVALCAAGCSKEDASTTASSAAPDAIKIPETVFIEMINDVYLNSSDYLGKTLTYEGIFTSSEWENETYHYVIRYGPGCCGYDGEAGFEVSWEGPLPKDDDWAEAVGVLEEYEEDGYMYLRLRLSSLTVLDTRGAEFVAA